MSGSLDGVVVLDLSRALAGPHAAMMLGDLGARVIKVESPHGGDFSRAWGPPFVGTQEDPISTYFLSCNRNKESVTLDLGSEEGRRTLMRLVQHADLLIENFRPGVLDRLGFSVTRLHELNPRLVILSISGFGHDGPEAQRGGYDQIAQGEAGLMSLSGPDPQTPTKVGVPIGDLLAGIYGAYGAVAALYERSLTGRGRVVRTSLLAAIVGAHSFQGTRYTVAGEIPGGEGNHHPSISPYGMFECADGTLTLAVASDSAWTTFAQAFGIDPAESGMRTNSERVANRNLVTRRITTAFSAHRLKELLPRLAELGVPAGEVRTLDRVYASEQTRSQGLLIEVEHPSLGTITLPGPPLRFDDNAYAGGREHHMAPPGLGADNCSVQSWLDECDATMGQG